MYRFAYDLLKDFPRYIVQSIGFGCTGQQPPDRDTRRPSGRSGRDFRHHLVQQGRFRDSHAARLDRR